MTICLAAICDNGGKIIVASDRMITVGGLSQEFEHGTPKMQKLSESCLAVTAGDALKPIELFRMVIPSISRISNVSVYDIIESIKEKFLEMKRKLVEEEFLKSRGFTIKSFYEKFGSLPPQVSLPLDDKIENYKLGLEMIIAGVDDEGAHIYQVDDPGTSNCFNVLGYCAIGSGTPHSLSTFITNDYNSTVSFKEALFIAFEAKRKAENAPGVGQATDMWIITRTGTKKVDSKILDRLQEIYLKKMDAESIKSQEIKSIIASIEVDGVNS